MGDSYRSVVEGGPGIRTNAHSSSADELQGPLPAAQAKLPSLRLSTLFNIQRCGLAIAPISFKNFRLAHRLLA
jgi:hypothetical protein